MSRKIPKSSISHAYDESNSQNDVSHSKTKGKKEKHFKEVIFLVVGALLAFGGSFLHDYIKEKNDEENIALLINSYAKEILATTSLTQTVINMAEKDSSAIEKSFFAWLHYDEVFNELLKHLPILDNEVAMQFLAVYSFNRACRVITERILFNSNNKYAFSLQELQYYRVFLDSLVKQIELLRRALNVAYGFKIEAINIKQE